MNILSTFYKFVIVLALTLVLTGAEALQAQTFYGYQTIGRNTVFFSVAWQGKPMLGVGYINRSFATTFMDTQAEIRFPINEMFTFTDFQVIAGIYKPNVIKRSFMGFGGHLRLEKQTEGEQKTFKLSLAATAMPSYVYINNGTNANTNDGSYGTTGLRITYAPVLLAVTKGGEGGPRTQGLSAHKIELGGHADLHLERTLGLSLNGFVSHSFIPKNSILPQDNSWNREGDFYFGTTYRLKRI